MNTQENIQILSRIEMEQWLRENLLVKDAMLLRNLAQTCGLNNSDVLRYQIIWILHWLLDRFIELSKDLDGIELGNLRFKIKGEKLGLVTHGKTQLGMKLSRGFEIDNDLLTGQFIPKLADFVLRGWAIRPANNEINMSLLERYLLPVSDNFAPPSPPPGVTIISNPLAVHLPETDQELVPTIPPPPIKKPRGRPRAEPQSNTIEDRLRDLENKIHDLENIMRLYIRETPANIIV